MKTVERRGEMVSLCSLRVGERAFAIETTEIREVVRSAWPQRVPLAPAYLAGVVAYRGEVLTTVSLRELLDMETRREIGCLVVLEAEGESFGLMVDDVDGEVSVPREALETNPADLDERSRALCAGACRLETGWMVRLVPRRLWPGYLGTSGLFAETRLQRGETR